MRIRSLVKSRTGRGLAAGAAALAVAAGVALLAPAVATADSQAQAVSHRVPFPCGQTWAGETRGDHSPLRAVDFNRAGDFGDRATASAGGKIVHRGEMAGTSYGRLVVIEHGNGTASYYAHLSEYRVRLNDTVKKGQTIGLVGGSATPDNPSGYGPHLHYEQRTAYNGNSVPIKFNNADVHYYGTRNYTAKC